VREGRRCALLVAGAGWLEPELRRVVAKHAIPDVFFVGFLQLTEIMRAYACADVFTLFSGLNETWGLVVNEAMNFSLPIVVSDRVGCGRDLVSSGRNGWVVSTDDTDTLAARFDSLLASSELRQRFGKEPRDHRRMEPRENGRGNRICCALRGRGLFRRAEHISSAMRCPGWVGSSGVKRCNL
jgi:glycosyltransferase involved in cell wall biosynthesis